MSRLITPIYVFLCLVIIAALACLPNQSSIAAAPAVSPRYIQESFLREAGNDYRRLTDTKTGKCLIIVISAYGVAVANDQSWCAQGE